MVAGILAKTILYGGIFMYPADSRNPKGKLRLMYQCNPVHLLLKLVEGKAITGYSRVLEEVPNSLHERCPIFIGSPYDIDKVAKFIADTDAELEKPL